MRVRDEADEHRGGTSRNTRHRLLRHSQGTLVAVTWLRVVMIFNICCRCRHMNCRGSSEISPSLATPSQYPPSKTVFSSGISCQHLAKFSVLSFKFGRRSRQRKHQAKTDLNTSNERFLIISSLDWASLQDEEKCVSIEISEVVEQQFACRYLNLFTKVGT